MTRPLSKKLYDNILAVAPSGEPLCRCNQDKANWYLKRDLAEVVSDNPTVIRLKFEPKGKGHAGDDFYLAERQNHCAVCGKGDDQTRHHIVPYCFRRFFPDKLKSHNSHDIVPLCVVCHDKYEIHADELKKLIGQTLGVAYGGNTAGFDPAKLRVKRHGTALLFYRDRIPPDRLALLVKSLKDYYGKDQITEADIQDAAHLDPAVPAVGGRKKFGEVVVEKVKDLDAFVKMWRRHFVKTMQPKHMPPHWTVERNMTND